MRTPEIPSPLLDCFRQEQVALFFGASCANEDSPALPAKEFAKLPIRIIITAAPENGIEQSVRRAGQHPIVISREEDVSYFDENALVIINIHHLLIDFSGDDIHLQGENIRFLDLVRRIFATRTILVAHWDPGYINLKSFYREISREFLENHPPIYALADKALGKEEEKYWADDNSWKILTDENHQDASGYLRSFLDSASRELESSGFEEDKKELSVPEDLDINPYKNLDYFDESDFAIFYGRERETQELVTKTLSHRMALLFGPSGAGKTSLIRAGAMTVLRESGYFPLYVRPGKSLSQSIKMALRENQLSMLALNSDIVDMLKDAIKETKQSFIIFIDQFEEVFVNLTKDVQEDIIQTVDSIFADSGLDVHLVLSVRQDFLANLFEFSFSAPVLNNRLQLHGLSQHTARDAMISPAQLCGYGFEEALAENIVEELSNREEISPPQLQIICSQLWASAQEDGEKRITVSLYQRLGEAEAILSNHLENVLDSLPETKWLGPIDPKSLGEFQPDEESGRHKGSCPAPKIRAS